MAMEPQQMAMDQMAPEQMGMEQDPMQDPRAVEALQQPSQEIQAVLVSRLSNMSPEDLQMLDSVITPQVASILVRLLPELQQIIDMAQSQEQPMPEEQMGALGAMQETKMAIDLFKTGTEELPTSSTTLTGTDIPEWVSAGGKQLYEQAVELAQAPFPTYEGNRIATYDSTGPIPETDPLFGQGFTTYEDYFAANPDAERAQSKFTSAEQQGMNLLTGPDSNSYQSYVDDAKTATDALAGGYTGMTAEELIGEPIDAGTFSAADAEPYMNMYQASQDEAIRQLEREREQMQNQRAGEASMRGAFGGSRAEIGDMVGSAEYAAKMADLRSQAGTAGLEFGASRFDADRAARLNQAELDRSAMLGQQERDRSAMLSQDQLDREARFGAQKAGLTEYETEEGARVRKASELQSFAPLVQGLQEQEASGMITSGQAQRELDQMALDMAYSDYVQQTEYPMSMVNFAIGALKGIPYEQQQFGLNTGSQYVETPSIYGQGISALGSLASAYALSKRS